MLSYLCYDALLAHKRGCGDKEKIAIFCLSLRGLYHTQDGVYASKLSWCVWHGHWADPDDQHATVLEIPRVITTRCITLLLLECTYKSICKILLCAIWTSGRIFDLRQNVSLLISKGLYWFQECLLA